MAVAAPDREPGDEVMEHEVVQHDEPGRAAQRLHDPAVSLGIVADVVDAEIGPARRPSLPCATTTSSQRSLSAGTRSAE